ncbi:MAG: hypothetical protein KJ072_18890 [Verrucomicrobia bacterium]|nr:hypothetical protein [Verrucomicrobiota bacterium]
MNLRPLFWSLLLAGFGFGRALQADTIITNCSEAALEAALDSGGRIVLSCSGTVTHRTTKVISTNTVLETANSLVTLSGGGSNRLFTIHPGVTLTLRGLTLAHGSHQGATGRDGGELESGASGKPGFGGAIFNDGGTLIAVEVIFTTNRVTGGDGGRGANGRFFGTDGRSGGGGGAATGGAILNRSGALLLTNCTFISNQALGGLGGPGGDGASAVLSGDGGDGGDGGHGQGGAIHSEAGGQVILVDCTFASNLAEGGPAGDPGLTGSGVAFDGAPGAAGRGEGGAVRATSSSLVGLRSTFNDNRVRGADGRAGFDGFDSRTGMDGSDGGAGRGGALAIEHGSAAFTNSTFFANNATGGAGGDGGDGGDGGNGGNARGGSAYLGPSSPVSFVHCTFSKAALTGGSGGAGGAAGASTANSGGRGSTGRAEGANVAADSPTVELRLTVLAYGDGGHNAFGPINDGGANLSSDATPPFDHQQSLNDIDPLLGNLSNNGGLTRTLALSSASPARDRGGDLFLVDTDQRGYRRLEAPDAGAFEYGGAADLAIEVNGDSVILSWPAATPPMQLESSTSLTSPNWQPVEGAALSGSMLTVTHPATGSARFYRLSP